MDIRTQKFAIACLARIHIHGLTLLSLLKSQLLECGLWGSDFRKQAVFHYAMLSEATHVPCFHSIQAKLVCLKPGPRTSLVLKVRVSPPILLTQVFQVSSTSLYAEFISLLPALMVFGFLNLSSSSLP